MWEEIEMLKYHPHLLAHFVNIVLGIGDIHTIKPDLTLGRLLQQIQTAQKRTLSRTTRSDDNDLLALLDFIVDSV